MEKLTPKMIRAQLNMSQDKMAEYLNISRQTYNYKETGKTEFSFIEVKKICELAGISMDAFDV